MSKFAENIAEETVDLHGEKAVGAEFYRKTIVFPANISNGSLFITENSELGDLEIENIVLRTRNGLTGGTTFRIISNNAYGTVVIMEVPVAVLGSSKTVDLAEARMRSLLVMDKAGTHLTGAGNNHRTILEQGKNLQAQYVGVDTGASAEADGMDILIKFKRIGEYGSVKLK